MKITHCLVALCAVFALSSCKVRIVVPEGGSVTTQSGAYSCAAGKTCNIDVVDFFFDQTFIAKPASGYKFKFWKKADRRFCGNDSKPCRLYTKGLNANQELASVMLSFFETTDEVFYLQPIFEKTGGGANTLYVSGNGPPPSVPGYDILSVNPANGAVIAGYDSGLPVGMADLAFVNGQLYGIEDYGTSLYKINFGSKTKTKIGNTGVLIGGIGSLLTVNGELYLLDALSDVYKVNLNTGFASPTGRKLETPATFDSNGNLWVLSSRITGGYYLQTVDFNTGSVLKSVVVSGAGSYSFWDMAFTKTGLIAITSSGGTLVRIDPATGQATAFAAIDIGLYPGLTSN